MAKVELRPGIIRAGVVQVLRCRRFVHELPGPGDILQARMPSSGGWIVEVARWIAADMVMLDGARLACAAE